ncbi:MAG: fused MFS/spermidine synthase [Gemmatimonadota bacterium]
MTEIDRADRSRLWLYGAFTASGVAGLVYELVWTRYLALIVGHSAYAQVLVIAVYLSGLAAGALFVGDRSEALPRPLLRYAAVEAVLAVAGLLFHPVFRLVTSAAYGAIFPGLTPGALGAVRWAIAVVLILPQATLLGTTFPLMTAGVIRRTGRAGRAVAMLYFVNTLGGAAGVLLAGFVLIAWLTLPGTVVAAAVLNGLAATVAWRVARRPAVAAKGAGAGEVGAPGDGASWAPAMASSAEAAPSSYEGAPGTWSGPFSRDTLWTALLAVSFGTAMASFVYEIGWIRMLSLVLASATHSFEIMLSAFLLGLALGSLMIRRAADGSARPVRLLGWIQWLMGLAALATLPVYARSFHTMSWLFHTVPHTAAGYPWFNLGRYGLALGVMLPATLLAGMTLPLITGTLLRAGTGERAIGWVYGVNTLGSVLGVALAELLLMPWLGVQSMLAAGAALDMALGIGLLAFAGGRGMLRRWLPAGATTLVTVLAVGGAIGLPLSKVVLSSGVFRHGNVPSPDAETVLYYADGRTATVAAYVLHEDGRVVLATNGKPDASLSQRWLNPDRSPGNEPTWNPDEPTQIFTGLLPLVFRPDARTAVVIGQGSGITTHFLLGSPRLRHVTTVEIEPDMIHASTRFYPANRRAFDDPRSEFVIDDARSFFASRHRRYDIITSEPSNPWVSGTSDLFTKEFYHRVRQYLTKDGVFVQWLQLYEMNDDLVLDILAAVHQAFPAYRAYMIADADMLIVAGNGPLRKPDWSIVRLPRIARDLSPLPAFTPDLLESLHLFDRSVMAPLLDGRRHVNSDYDPIVDLRADRARFLDAGAAGFGGLADHRFDIVRALEGRRRGFAAYTLPPVGNLPAMFNRARSNWVHAAMRGDSLTAPPQNTGRVWTDYAELAGNLPHLGPPADWNAWVDLLESTADAVQGGTAGVPDTLFWNTVYRYVDRVGAPTRVRQAIDFLYGAAAWDFQRVRRVAPDLIAAAEAGHPPLDPGEIMDVACVAYLKAGAPDQALDALRRLAPLAGRSPDDVRTQLLRAWAVQVAGGR